MAQSHDVYEDDPRSQYYLGKSGHNWHSMLDSMSKHRAGVEVRVVMKYTGRCIQTVRRHFQHHVDAGKAQWSRSISDYIIFDGYRAH